MTLEGRLLSGNKLLQIHEIKYENPEASFVKELDEALVELCRQMDIPMPVWMKQNTREFATFHQTIFFDEQFLEKVRFDKFQIKMIR